jgi:putative nucleotidyltransferase with HDIG domain
MTEPFSRSPNAQDSPALLSCAPRNLRLGMYINLNCSWFLHPFPCQSFKLTNETQITTIQGLGLSAVFVDPAQSDRGVLDECIPLDHATTRAEQPASRQTDLTATSSDKTSVPPISPSIPAVEDFSEGLHSAKQAYRDACHHLKQAMRDLHSGSEEGVAAAKIVTNKLAQVLVDDETAGALAGLFDSSGMSERDLIHALNVSALSMMVGQQFQLSAEDLKILGIGALLHDIGELNVSQEIVRKGTQRTPEEQLMYRQHPTLGLQLLERIPSFPQEALRVIEFHHERTDGSGYPNQLTEEFLSLFTKIVMVIDEYDTLINHEDPQQKLTPADALSHLYRTSRTTFASEVITGLIQTLSVYPPGTIVELVNGAYALVLNINRQARMKPLVLLYTPHTANAEPIVINLMQDRTRSIARRPPLNQLPPRVRDYLDLNRWIGHFLASAADGGLPSSDAA